MLMSSTPSILLETFGIQNPPPPPPPRINFEIDDSSNSVGLLMTEDYYYSSSNLIPMDNNTLGGSGGGGGGKNGIEHIKKNIIHFANCTWNETSSSYYYNMNDINNADAANAANINISCGNMMMIGSTNDNNDSSLGGGPTNNIWIISMVLLLYSIVCIVGLCGNTLVIYVVVRFSKMQTVTNLYIVNLAIADELFLIGIPFLMATTYLGYWPFGEIMCKIYFTTTSVNQITSSMFLLIMSADRFMAVCHPITATNWRTPLVASVVALTAWCLSAIIMVPIFIYASTATIDGKVTCNIFWPTGWINGEATFMIYSFLLGFAIPLTLTSIFYVLVIVRLRRLGPKRQCIGINQQNTKETHMNRSKERKKSHRKVTKLVLTVITVYFLCWAPQWITQLTLISMNRKEQHSSAWLAIFLLAGCLSYSNSAMNPILYAFLSDNFKKSFMKACSCANRRDVNAALNVENSIFPRRGNNKKSIDQRTSVGSSSGQKRMIMNSSSPSIKCPMIVTEPIEEEDDSDEECIGILSSPKKSKIISLPLPTRSVISEMSNKSTQETFIENGVHVTAL